MAIKNKRLKLLRGSTYTFDVSDSALSNYPLKFTSDSGTTEYTTGITLTGTQGQAGASLEFVVDSSIPNNLNYYNDSADLKMGNHVFVPGTAPTPSNPMDPYVLQRSVMNPNAYGTPANDTFSDAISMSSTHVIAGAHQEDDAGIYSSGRAYIFDISNGSLVHTLANTAGYSTTDYDQFGDAVGISNSYAVVGAPRDQITSQYKPGYAHMYNVSDGTLRYSLANPWANSNNHLNTEQKFGHAVDINETYAIVGAIGQRHADQSSSADQGTGKAYVFNTSNGQLAHTLNNPRGPLAGDQFGQSVSISDTHAIVSSRGSGGNGAAFVYDNNFSLLYTLNNPNPSGASTDDYFGEGAAISNTHAIVAAPYEDSASTNDVGKAYIYDLSDGSLLHTLSNPGTDNYFAYGGAVGIDSDHAIVGAIYAGGHGKAYIFNVSDGSLKSTISSPSGQAGNWFGYGGVEIKGKKAVVGQPYYDDSAGNTAAGAFYIYEDPTVADPTAYNLNQNFFLNAIKAYDSDTNTYDNYYTELGGDFNDVERIATNGTYTLFADPGTVVSHTGTGTTGTNTPVASAGWTWLIRNADGQLMKSWNGMLNGDTVNLNTLDLETYYIGAGGGTAYYSKFHTCRWGSHVTMTSKYMFISVQYRPTGGSNTSLNWSDRRAYISVYSLSTLQHVHTFALEDFYGSSYIEAKSGASGTAGGGTSWSENLHFTDEENLFVGATAAADPNNNSYEEGAITWWDISDANPANWSTNPDAVIRNPINTVSNPVTTVGGINYSNKYFGQKINFKDNTLIVGNTVWLRKYTKSGSSFSLNSSLSLTSQSENYISPGNGFMSTDNTNVISARTTDYNLTARDYNNTFSLSWNKANDYTGYPSVVRQLLVGKDTKVELAAWANSWAKTKAGVVSFLKTSDRTSVLELDNPFTRDSDGLYFGQGLGIGHIDSANSNKYSLVSWGEPDDVNTEDIVSFNILEWDSDTGSLYLEGNAPGAGFYGQVQGVSISSTITGTSVTDFDANFMHLAQSSGADKSYYVAGAHREASPYQTMLIKYDKDGVFQWIRGFGSNGTSNTKVWQPYGVLVDPSDHKPIAYGQEYGYGLNFNPPSSGQFPAGFQMKFDTDGNQDTSKIFRYNNMPSQYPNNARTNFIMPGVDSYGNIWSIFDHDQVNDQISNGNFYRDVVALCRHKGDGTLGAVYFMRPGTSNGTSSSAFKEKSRIEPRGLLVDGSNLYVTSETSDGDKEAHIHKLTISSETATPAYEWTKSHAYGDGSTSQWYSRSSNSRFKPICIDPSDNNIIMSAGLNDGDGSNGNQFGGWRTGLMKIDASDGSIIWGKVLDGSNGNAALGTWTQGEATIALHNTNYLMVTSNVYDTNNVWRMFCRLINISDGTTHKVYELNATGTATGGNDWSYRQPNQYSFGRAAITNDEGCAVTLFSLQGSAGADIRPSILKFPKDFSNWTGSLGTQAGSHAANIELTDLTSSYTDQDMTFAYVASSDPISFGAMYGNFGSNFSFVGYNGSTYSDGSYTPTTTASWKIKI